MSGTDQSFSWLRIEPDFDSFVTLISKSEGNPNIVPLSAKLPGYFLTPSTAYLRISAGSKQSFLLESVIGNQQIARYSWIGSDPIHVIETGPNCAIKGDPITELERVLSGYRTVSGTELPFTGGAVGYVSYECVHYFEPKTAREVEDHIGIPEAVFMLHNSILAFDHICQTITVISNAMIPDSATTEQLRDCYDAAVECIKQLCRKLEVPNTPLPPQPEIVLGNQYSSNVGQEGYETYVRKLKEWILEGQIFQAVPSQRVTRPTSLHPFNVYLTLRTVNPSPYMFYIDCGDFQLVGAAHVGLIKSEHRKIITQLSAGTIRRGSTTQEDDKLAQELKNSIKDRAEHVMLVDLNRNDVNRVCNPLTTSVDSLMDVERFSHVSHLVSQVSGVLRPLKNRFDAFRSIFPAGMVTGTPKLRAIQLIGSLEKERRGVYAGAVGRWGYEEDNMDTCPGLRTMVFKGGVAYLQAGGGIVYDNEPYDEYVESMNKLKSNITTIETAERIHFELEERMSSMP